MFEKEYRVKKTTEFVIYTHRTSYYPQVKRFGIWFYMFDSFLGVVFFIDEQSAWDYIESRKSSPKVEYIYKEEDK